MAVLAVAIGAIGWIIYGFATAGEEGRKTADKTIASIEADIANPPKPTTLPTVPAPSLDAVLAKVAGAGATNVVINTPEDDPNELLGRPGGYKARAAFDLPGGNTGAPAGSVERGGSVEIHPTAALAKTRSEYLTSMRASSPILGTEYDYLAGPVLVRVTGKVTPANAKKIEDVVATLPK